MSYKECNHEQGEIGIKKVSEGYFKVFFCKKCKYVEALDYKHDGSTYDHTDQGFESNLNMNEDK